MLGLAKRGRTVATDAYRRRSNRRCSAENKYCSNKSLSENRSPIDRLSQMNRVLFRILRRAKKKKRTHYQYKKKFGNYTSAKTASRSHARSSGAFVNPPVIPIPDDRLSLWDIFDDAIPVWLTFDVVFVITGERLTCCCRVPGAWIFGTSSCKR